ncbi:hypothetical protein FACS1894216_14890 [Synergistales bacterium]|nr:hypothetical protein FACS1894216_14890 [Synergistales bacterium]
MLNAFVLFPALFVAFTVKLKVPAADGVPLIVPVEAFSVNPPGKAPSSIAHVIGALPVASMGRL